MMGPYPTIKIFLFLICWKVCEQSEVTIMNAVTCNITKTFCREPDLKQYGGYPGIAKSGYLKLFGKDGSGLAFSFYGAKGITDSAKLAKIPTVLVLAGGPGASSQFNHLQEMGPFLLKKVFTISVAPNQNAWTQSYNLLFIDQPVGTGVSCLASTSHLTTSLKQIIDDLYFALNQLFTADDGCFNILGIPPSVPLFLLGESYGGKYVSALGYKLMTEAKNKGIITGLKGIIIADGFNAPWKIFSEVGNHAFSMGLLDYQERMHIQKILLRASIQYEEQNFKKMGDQFFNVVEKLQQFTGVQRHDITKDLPQEFIINEFYQNSTKLKQFGFESSTPFSFFSSAVMEKLREDYMKDQIASVEKLLDAKVPVWVYQGQDDLIVSNSGTMKWVDEINYSNSKDFRNKNFSQFKVNGSLVALTKSSGKLTFTVFLNAGHFAAADSPSAVYEMAKQFISANS